MNGMKSSFALQYNICFIIICTCDFFLYIKLKKCNIVIIIHI